MKKALVLLAAALVGCGPSLAFTRTGATLPAKPSSCDITVLAAAPSETYQELGTIDIQYKSQTEWISTEKAFTKRIRPLVCQAGGEAAIAHTNQNGLYMKATVLSFQPPQKDPPPAAAPATPENAVDDVTSSAGGEKEGDPLLDSKPPAPEPKTTKTAEAKSDKK